MGTCIGKRNIRYFVSFLAFTSLHALLTAVMDTTFFVVKTVPIMNTLFDKSHEIPDD